MARLAWIAVAISLLLAGCGQSPLSTRYHAERDLWRARQVERRVWNNPEAAGSARADAIALYETMLDRYPTAGISPADPELRALIAARTSARLGLSRLYLQARRTGRAVRLLTEARGEAAIDLDFAIRLHTELLQILSAGGREDTLALVLQGMADTLPAADPDGKPIPLVIEALIRRADLIGQSGRREEAIQALSDAITFYREAERKYSGTETEIAAIVQRSKAEIRLGRYDEAEGALESARSLPAAAKYEPEMLFSQAGLRLEGKKDAVGALELLHQLVTRFPEDALAPQAQLQIGGAWAALALADSAFAAFELLERKFPRQIEVVAQARLSHARTLTLENRWPEAVRKLRSLQADYPRTTAGMLAPLELAGYYEKNGDTAARRAALLEAAAAYERLAEELARDPQTRDLVRSALDFLVEATEKLGDYDRAVRALLTRADGFPGESRSPLAYLRAAALQEVELHDRAAAIATLEKITQRYPDLPIAAHARERIGFLRGPS